MVNDRYTSSQMEAFFKDAQRLTDDLFQTPTFKSYLALFNVYAVFVPSKESGITDLTKKNTTLGLYRSPAGSKRAIMPADTSFIESVLKLAPATGYPILIANDNFYGGLGGRYAITARSVRSGAIVLRHELGHKFGNIGEEYDGGQVYQGANSSDDPKSDWSEWFTHCARKYEAKFLTGDYFWQNLRDGAYTDTFYIPATRNGRGFTFELWISTVGWQTPSDVTIELDGAKVTFDGEFTFLARVKLFDSVTVGENKRNEKMVKLSALSLDDLAVNWYKIESDGTETELSQYRDLLNWKIPEGLKGKFRVRASFETDEVRAYTKDFKAKYDFTN
ncbi:MAG: hypothetical protein KA715_10720 [Xanthomonadaceae bacterium]|nr:hypothetical protein [Xanthomonadaceae bacterium]